MRRMIIFLFVWQISSPLIAKTLAEQNDDLFLDLKKVHNLKDDILDKIKGIFAKSGFLSQGNPAITKHPVSSTQCHEKLAEQKINYENQKFEEICHGKYMSPLFNKEKESIKDAKVCIDQFEFPNIPCQYPVVWVRAKEAAEICEAMGKRLCDAHEWEGACAGSLEPTDYRFDLAKGLSPEAAINKMRFAHNKIQDSKKSWAYGSAYKKGICGAASQKDKDCNGGDWKKCGSNTYPDGYFPGCKSVFEVYDLHGNAAEHMNLPLDPTEMSSHPSKKYGHTEMKGSWFIFDHYLAHPDHCRWRAPYWHGSRVMDEHSHQNYHLGFRCCKTIENGNKP